MGKKDDRHLNKKDGGRRSEHHNWGSRGKPKKGSAGGGAGGSGPQIWEAAADGDIDELREVVGELVEKGTGNFFEAVNFAGGDLGCAPLHAAAAAGHELVVAELLQHTGGRASAGLQFAGFRHHGVEVLKRAKRDGSTALHAAAASGHCGVIKRLLVHIPGPLLPDEAQAESLPASRGGRSRGGAEPSSSARAGFGVDQRTNDGRSALQEAVEANRIEVARALLEHGAQAGQRTQRRSTLLHFAAEVGFAEMLRLLLDFTAPMDAQDQWLWSPLHRAANLGHAACVEALIGAGANPNLEDGEGMRPLERAVAGRHEACEVILFPVTERLEEDEEEQRGLLQLSVDRADILRSSLCGLGETALMEGLKHGRPMISFVGEEGLDAGGVFRDWLASVASELFCPDHGLVIRVDHEDAEGLQIAGGLPYVSLSPVPEHANEDFRSYLVFMGRLLGLSLRHGVPLGVCLAPALCKLILGRDAEVCFQDLRFVTPRQWQQLDICLRESDESARAAAVERLGEALGEELRFAAESREARALRQQGLWRDALRREDSELLPGGRERIVRGADFQEYCELLARKELVSNIQHLAADVRAGLLEVVALRPSSAFARSVRDMAPEALEEAIMGQLEVDANAWRARTEYLPEGREEEPRYKEVIAWFWEVVEAMSPEQRGDLLFFCCAYRRLPARGDGWFAMRINLSDDAGEEGDEEISDWDLPLPTAHTCGNLLVLPLYRSKEALAEKLSLAVASAAKAGFGFL